MSLTRPSLLRRLQSSQDTAGWKEFAAIYSCVVNDYARAYRRSEHDQKDIVQNVWVVLCRIMPSFHYQPDRGGFRHLLRKIVKNSAVDWFRKRGAVREMTDNQPRAARVADDVAALDEHRNILHRSLERTRGRSSALAWACFERHVMEQQPARDVGQHLGLSANAVYVNASRVLDRVRTLCIQTKKAGQHD